MKFLLVDMDGGDHDLYIGTKYSIIEALLLYRKSKGGLQQSPW